MPPSVEKRRRWSRVAVWGWKAQVPVALLLYLLSLRWQWAKDLLIPYLIALSVETGIESAIARRNADL